MESENETLRLQFKALQEQQQKKMQRRLQRQEDKKKKDEPAEGDAKPVGLNIGDDLGLSLNEGIPNDAIYSEELNTHLNQQIRELKDETGRLYKLLSERDYEIRRLKKQRESERIAIAGSGVASETAATKIVDLSKKNRDLKSELESEKSKVKQILKKLNETEKQLNERLDGNGSKGLTTLDEPTEKEQLQAEMKQIQDKLNQTTSKMMEYRNQTGSLKQELKLAHKVLTQEVGEHASVQALLSSKGGARGRAQQILNLQNKVTELESQLNQQRLTSMANRPDTQMSLEDQFMTMDIPDDKSESVVSARTYKTSQSATADKNRTKIRQMEKERKEAQAKANEELKALQLDYSKLKEKFDASKARNKVLSNELKSVKQQVNTFVEKGKHDDELISALLKQQSQLNEVYNEKHRQQEEQKKQQQQHQQLMQQQSQQDMNVVEQLKRIVAEKEQKVHILEEEINQMRLKQEERHTTINGFVERPPSRGSRPSSSQVERPGTRVVSFDTSMNGQFSSGPLPPSRNGSRHSARSSSRQSLGSLESPGRPSSTSVRPSSVNAIDIDDLRRQCQEYKSISQVADVEREKLMELVAVLQRRVEEANQSQAAANSQVQELRRHNVQLEKQLGKMRIDTGRKGGMQSQTALAATMKTEEELLKTDIKLTAENMEELQTRLAIQIDENDALKAALQSTMKSKDEDLKLYHQMMEQTRKVFLQGLRQFKQTSIGS